MINKVADLEQLSDENIKPRNVSACRSFHEDDSINLKECAAQNRRIKIPHDMQNRLSDDQRMELKECNAKIKESRKRKNVDSINASTTPLPPDLVIKSRYTTLILCKKTRKDIFLR